MSSARGSHWLCENCFRRTATYFCEHCQTVVCSRCLSLRQEPILVCRTCHSTDLNQFQELTLSGDQVPNYRCNQCNTVGVIEATRRIRQCPKCLSEEVVDTSKKLKTLYKAHRDAINRLACPDRILQKASGKFSECRERLFKIRNLFLHYPSLETNLLRVHQALPRIQDQILTEVHNLTQQFRKMAVGLKNFSDIPPRSIRVYDEAVNQLVVEAGRIDRYCHDLLSPLDAHLTQIGQRLDELESWANEYDQYEKLVPFTSDELFVGLIHNVRILGSDFEPRNRHTGILMLTNRRLILLGEKGIFRRHLDKLLEYYLPSQSQVKEQGRFNRHLSLAVRPGHIRITSLQDENNALVRLYQLAVDFDNRRLQDLHLTRQVGRLRVDLGEFKHRLQENIRSTVTRSRVDYIQPAIPITNSPKVYEYQDSPRRSDQTPYSKSESPSFLFDSRPVQTTQTSSTKSTEDLTSNAVPNLNYLFDSVPTAQPPVDVQYTPPSSTSSSPSPTSTLGLNGERHSINATIQWLKEQWDRAKISQQDYLLQYRELMRQLYIVETRLRGSHVSTSSTPNYL